MQPAIQITISKISSSRKMPVRPTRTSHKLAVVPSQRLKRQWQSCFHRRSLLCTAVSRAIRYLASGKTWETHLQWVVAWRRRVCFQGSIVTLPRHSRSCPILLRPYRCKIKFSSKKYSLSQDLILAEGGNHLLKARCQENRLINLWVMALNQSECSSLLL